MRRSSSTLLNALTRTGAAFGCNCRLHRGHEAARRDEEGRFCAYFGQAGTARVKVDSQELPGAHDEATDNISDKVA